MRRAGGVWEPGPRHWLSRRHRMGPLIRNLRRATHRPGRASVSDTDLYHSDSERFEQLLRRGGAP